MRKVWCAVPGRAIAFSGIFFLLLFLGVAMSTDGGGPAGRGKGFDYEGGAVADFTPPNTVPLTTPDTVAFFNQRYGVDFKSPVDYLDSRFGGKGAIVSSLDPVQDSSFYYRPESGDANQPLAQQALSYDKPGDFITEHGYLLPIAVVTAGVALNGWPGAGAAFEGANAADLAMELAPGSEFAAPVFEGANAADLAMELAPGSEFLAPVQALAPAVLTPPASAVTLKTLAEGGLSALGTAAKTAAALASLGLVRGAGSGPVGVTDADLAMERAPGDSLLDTLGLVPAAAAASSMPAAAGGSGATGLIALVVLAGVVGVVVFKRRSKK